MNRWVSDGCPHLKNILMWAAWGQLELALRTQWKVGIEEWIPELANKCDNWVQVREIAVDTNSLEKREPRILVDGW